MYGMQANSFATKLKGLFGGGKRTPETAAYDDPSPDPLVDNYWMVDDEIDLQSGPKLLTSPHLQPLKFDHLIMHSDAEGLYLPIEFEGVLLAANAETDYVEMIGSSHILLREIKVLASALELPLDLNPESEEVWQAAENARGMEPNDTVWKRFGIESYICIRLYRAAKASVDNSAAIVFG